jgi:hypothetical protein
LIRRIDVVGELGKKKSAKNENASYYRSSVIVLTDILEESNVNFAQLQITDTPFGIVNNKSDEWQE